MLGAWHGGASGDGWERKRSAIAWLQCKHTIALHCAIECRSKGFWGFGEVLGLKIGELKSNGAQWSRESACILLQVYSKMGRAA